MKNRFPGHYKPSVTEFKNLWDKCLFVPDANILLHLFRYGEKTRAQVFETLKRLMPRVWIPYQVGLEFHRRWRDVDQANRDAYDKLAREIETEGRKLSGLFNEYTRHQIIDVKLEQSAIDEFIKSLCERLSKNKEKHPSREEAEKIFNGISELIGDSVGERPKDAALDELIKEADTRYDASIPPGYRDAKSKDAPEKYGDFFIWKEILRKAKSENTSVIVITDDVKDDWWQEFRGQKVGPRPELIEEMKNYSGQTFYLYTLSQFLDYAAVFLNQKLDSDAIEEIKSDEVQRRELARQETDHSLRRAGSREFLRFIREEQHMVRRRLAQIEAQIERVSDGDEAQIKRLPRLVAERRALYEELRQLARGYHDARYNFARLDDPNEGRKYAQLRSNLTSQMALRRARRALLESERQLAGADDTGSDESNEH